MKEHEKQLVKSNAFIEIYDYDSEKDSPELLKQKQIFNKLKRWNNKRHDEILELSKKINYEYLMYHFKDRHAREKSSNNFDNAISFLKNIRDGNITLEKPKKYPNEYK